MSAGSMRDWGKKLKWMFIMINVNQTKKKKKSGYSVYPVQECRRYSRHFKRGFI